MGHGHMSKCALAVPFGFDTFKKGTNFNKFKNGVHLWTVRRPEYDQHIFMKFLKTLFRKKNIKKKNQDLKRVS